MTHFFEGLDPHKDFLLVSYKKDSFERKILKKIKDKNSFFSNFFLDLESKVFIFSGQIKAVDSLFSGYVYSFYDKDGWGLGNFTYFKKDKSGRYVVGSDYFGLGVVYIYETKDFVAIANRLHLVVKFIEFLCLKVTVNKTAFNALSFASIETLGQPLTNDFPIAGLHRLPSGKKLLLNLGVASEEDDLLRKDRRSVGLGEITMSHYKELLNKGSKDIVDNIKSIADKVGAPLVVDLSGGKDSRMVLAAALTAMNNEDIQLFVKDTPGSLDLEIACAIANFYSLSFFQGSDVVLSAVSAREFIDDWRSYYFGEYNRAGIPLFSRKGNGALHHLSGGGGEVVTSTANVNWLRKLAPSDNLMNVAAHRYAKDAIESSVFSSLEKNKVIKMWAASFECNGQDLDDDLNWFYLNFRNRVHFGLNQVSFYNGDVGHFPLLSRNLYLASLILSENERRSGRLVFDVISSFDKGLALIPYDKSFPRAESDRAYQHDFLRLHRAHIETKKKSWLESQSEFKKSRMNGVVGSKVSSAYSDYDNELLSISIGTLDFLSSSDFSFDSDALFFIYRRLMSAFHAENRNFFKAYALNLISFGDFFDSNFSRAKGGEGVFPIFPEQIKGVSFESFDESVSLSISLDDFCLEKDFQVAVYFYINDELVERSWYKSLLVRSFARPDGVSGEYGFLIFLRFSGFLFKKKFSFNI